MPNIENNKDVMMVYCIPNALKELNTLGEMKLLNVRFVFTFCFIAVKLKCLSLELK